MKIETEMLAELEASKSLGTYLGPSRVVEALGSRVTIELGETRRSAVLALPCHYEPACGDVVLVIGRAEALYIIGVLQGTGPTTFNARGDLRIRAPYGTIELSSGRGIRMRAPAIKIAAERLDFFASELFERVCQATRWVKDALQLRAREVRVKIDGDYDLKAKRIRQRATGLVQIDGDKIHLG